VYECGAKMTLARIEPDKPGYDLRTFECTKCNNADQYVIEYEHLRRECCPSRQLGRLLEFENETF